METHTRRNVELVEHYECRQKYFIGIKTFWVHLNRKKESRELSDLRTKNKGESFGINTWKVKLAFAHSTLHSFLSDWVPELSKAKSLRAQTKRDIWGFFNLVICQTYGWELQKHFAVKLYASCSLFPPSTLIPNIKTSEEHKKLLLMCQEKLVNNFRLLSLDLTRAKRSVGEGKPLSSSSLKRFLMLSSFTPRRIYIFSKPRNFSVLVRIKIIIKSLSRKRERERSHWGDWCGVLFLFKINVLCLQHTSTFSGHPFCPPHCCCLWTFESIASPPPSRQQKRTTLTQQTKNFFCVP